MQELSISSFVLLDVSMRYAAVALLLISAILLLRDAVQHAAARYGAGVCITAAALLLGTPYPGFELPGALHVAIRFLDVGSIGFIWWFGLALFTDGFKLNRWHWLGMLLVVIPTAVFRAQELEFISIPLRPLLLCSAALTTCLMAHLVWVVLQGRSDDMVESRRNMRLYFVSGLILVTLAIALIERVVPSSYHVELSLFRVALILPFSAWAVIWLTQVQTTRLEFLPNPVVSTVTEPAVDPSDEPLRQALQDSMEQFRMYRQTGLTIRQLAEHLKVPEHRLRVLINQGLGYRNFSSFINDYRINAVKVSMQDSDNARTPILTLALDQGFNSLAPFNKAFRDRTGKTPTEYRELLARGDNPDL